MPTVEELKALELEEQRRHNRKDEKIRQTGNILGLFGKAIPNVSFRKQDGAWYLDQDPEQGQLAENVSYSDPLGIFNKGEVFAQTKVIEWVPSFGNIDHSGRIEGIEASLTNAFKVLRRNNVSLSAFSKGEYALYHFGKINIDVAILEVVKYLSLYNIEVSTINKSLPYGLAQAFGIDYDDLVENRINYISQLNKMIDRFNGFADMPESTMQKRYHYLAGSILKDHAKSKKNQFYGYVLRGIYKLNVSKSQLELFGFNDANEIHGDDRLMKIGEFLDIIDDMLTQFETSSTMDTIQGNISRAIEANPGTTGYTISKIPNDGLGLLPNEVIHDEALNQIQNTEIVTPFYDFMNASSSNGWIVKMNTSGTAIYYPNHRPLFGGSWDTNNRGAFICVSDVSGNVTTTNLQGYGGVANTLPLNNYYRMVTVDEGNEIHSIITSYTDKPTKYDTMVATRNRFNVWIDEDNNYFLEDSGSIVCVGTRTAICNVHSGTFADVSNNHPTVIYNRMATYKSSAANAYTEAVVCLLRSIDSQFDWQMIDHYSCTVTGAANLNVIMSRAINFEIDTWADVPRSTFNKLHRVALINEFAIPNLPKGKSNV